jgi:oligo-alginate lyase
METFQGIDRRTLIKLMLLASPAICESGQLLAGAEPAAFSATKHETRPRLFYSAASLGRIKRALAADAAADTALKHHGEELLAAALVPESVAEIGGGQHANYGTPAKQISEMGLTLGLLFHLTGDKRYAEKLREAMLHYATYVRWAGQGLADRFPQWHSELNTATFSFGYSTGYDALHGFLSEADKKTIADAMVRLAVLPILGDWVLPGTRLHSFDSMGHNWWGVCVAGGGLCALALLGDDPRAQAWVDAVDAGFIQWFDYPGDVLQNRMPTFERSGPSYEGVNYTNYGVSEYLHYRLAWQDTYPGRKAARMEPLDHITTYFLQTLYPTSSGFFTVNFEDAPPAVDLTETLLLLAACGLGAPDAARYLAHVHTHPQGTLLALLGEHSQPAAHGEAPTSFIYPRMGWAVMRSSWENDATFLAMKSGYTWNHAHADAGTFILYKQGKPLIIDSGTCAYSRPEYSTYYRLSRAHNVILFDGQGQPEEDIGLGCKFPGQMHCLVDGLGLKYAYADATGPMARWFTRNYRHWLWSGDLILVIDDVRAHTSGQMDWLLHYDGEYTADSNGGVRLKNGSAEAFVKILYPPTKRSEDMGLADHNPDKKVPYMVFKPDAPARSRQFLTAICLEPDAAPQFEVLEDVNYLGVRIHTKDAVEELYLDIRAVNSPGSIGIRIGDCMTDAYLVHLRQPAPDAPVERYFIGDGSYLRRGEQSIFESLSKATACWSTRDALQVFAGDGANSIQVASEHAPLSASWNGQPAGMEYDKQTKLVALKPAL